MSVRERFANLRRSYGATAENLDQPGGRRRAWIYYLLFDHALLRLFWHNFEQIAPGVYRANQPSPRRMAYYARMGLRTIINLRGPGHRPQNLLEVESCAKLGLTLVELQGLSARSAPATDVLLRLIDVMREAEKPYLFHCKSGADRTSLAAAIYLNVFEGVPMARAKRQLSWRFVHFRWTRSGILDHILERYETAHAQRGIGFEDWLRTEYDPQALQAEFDAART